ncbi:hypothetical protein [Nonomuraea sp. NPDC050786]|uniref:hypothetical protein n=1 Tax=Nonomuraea sp. NPDC050786 TaxID=3154840 RepID=UPI0033C9AB2B
MLNPSSFTPTLDFFTDQKLISPDEAGLVTDLFADDFPFTDALSIAESVHVQVKIDSFSRLPHESILAQGVVTERDVPGFRKYGFASGLAMIFTTGPIAEDDLIPGAVTRALPFVDHLGIDLREESERSRDIYAEIPNRGAQAGWRHVRQGGPESPVRGCYCEVSEKRWVFPPDGPEGRGRPIEFAFGEIEIFQGDVGCDYRPIDPAHPLAHKALPLIGRAQQSSC